MKKQTSEYKCEVCGAWLEDGMLCLECGNEKEEKDVRKKGDRYGLERMDRGRERRIRSKD